MTAIDAAPQHRRREVECDDGDFYACNAILKRVDVITEYCRVKDEFESCTEFFVLEKQCTIKKNSQVANTLQTLIDMDCQTVVECFQRLDNVYKIVGDQFFTDDDIFCSQVDSVISNGYFLMNNCNGSLPEYASGLADELILQNFESMKEIRCTQTVSPMITTYTATVPPIVTNGSITKPTLTTTRLTTLKPSTPTTDTPSSTTTENTSNLSPMTTVVTELSSLATTTIPPPTSTDSEHHKCFEQQFFATLEKSMNRVKKILRKFYFTPEEAKGIYCRIFKSSLMKSVKVATNYCGSYKDDRAMSLIQELVSTTEESLDQGCDRWNTDSSWDRRLLLFFVDDNDLFDDLGDDNFDDLFDDK